jgi:membrane dipeptidase
VIVDCHNDLLLETVFRRAEPNPFRRHYLPKLEQGGIRLQVCPLSVDMELFPRLVLEKALEQVASWHRILRENSDDVVGIRESGDLDGVEAGSRVGLLLAMEGVEPFGYDIDLAEVFWELGVRMVGLAWNRRNVFADGAGERAGGGLSELGRELVDRLVALRVILDLAHSSEATFYDTLERRGDAGVVVSHACCRALFDTPRNLSDDQLRALAGCGGVLGVMAIPLAVGADAPTLDRLLDHVDHAVATMGLEHVGLGADFMRQLVEAGVEQPYPANAFLAPGASMGDAIDGFGGPEDYPALVAGLRSRGYEGAALDAILGGNFLRLFRASLPSTPPGP